MVLQGYMVILTYRIDSIYVAWSLRCSRATCLAVTLDGALQSYRHRKLRGNVGPLY